MSRPSERVVSCRILAEVLQGQGSLASALGPDLKTAHPHLNAALVQEFCYGACRWYHRLHFIAQTLLDKPLRKRDTDLYCLILLGLYQLFFMRIPAHAALHETVEETAQLQKEWGRGLVNGVLREAQRREEELLAAIQRDYSLWYSHPEWLLTRLKRDWPADYRAILDANNARAPMTLRVNLHKVTREEYLARLLAAGIAATPGRLAPAALMLDSPSDVNALPGFAEGMVSVQDEASQLVSTVLPLEPGLRMLDACAAPGGKTCALLEAEPSLQVVAADKEERRLGRVRDNLRRLELRAEVLRADLAAAHPFSRESFDRILLDVPCSATGVIRRHPDIKLLRTEQEVRELVQRQAALLRAAWPLLKPGGYLLYSTCSVLNAENSGQIEAFVAEAVPAATVQHIQLDGGRPCKIGVQLLPTPGHQDGFYYALLRK